MYETIKNIDVFMCHATEDQRAVEELAQALEAHGVVTWIARRDIKAGMVWADAIYHAIQAAPVFVLMMSRAANASRHVVREIDMADHMHKSIVPIRLEMFQATGGFCYFTRSAHNYDWQDRGQDVVKRLVKQVELDRQRDASDKKQSLQGHRDIQPLAQIADIPQTAQYTHNIYTPAGPAGQPSVPWLPDDELALESGVDQNLGINIGLRNVGTRQLKRVEFKLYLLRTFHRQKRKWREQQREVFTFGRTVDLQPDEHTEGHWLAFLAHTGKIELQLPQGSYVPNPETRPQIFEAKIQIMCDKGGRTEILCFSWLPGQAPHVLTAEEIYNLEHGT